MNEMNDLISVIVPVYNVEKYLKECIESIINQTYKNLEIILVDDGSPDNCGKICDNYAKQDKRIKVIHKENGGVSSARNKGLEACTGKYITFVDSDDFIELNFCEVMLKKIKETASDCIVSGYNRVYENKSETIMNSQLQIINQMEFLQKILQVQLGMGFCHMKLWKSEIIIKNNIKFDSQLLVGEDALFCMQASEYVQKVCLLDRALYNYRFNTQSLVRKYDNNYANKYLEAMKKTTIYLFSKYNNNLEITKKTNNYITYHVLLIVVNYCFNTKNGLSFFKQTESLKNTCNIVEFKNAIEKCDYKGFSLSRKIAVFTLKKRLYFITAIIAKVRQFQFRR